MPEYIKIIIQVIGGLALFIFGMERLSSSLQKITSNKLKSVINILSKRPWAGIFVGTAITAVIQSSSATSVMTVGFVNAGLMTLRQAIGIIMGANIGTTVTAQIVAFKVDMLSYPLIIIGFVMFFAAKRRILKTTGMAILGLGLLFLGMTVMSGAFGPLKDNEKFREILVSFGRNPFLGLLVGMITTGILQSSSATIGVLIALASQGIITMDIAIPILIGDNIGTCVTALLASIGTTITAKRTALSHLMFNIFGTVIFFILLYAFKLQHFIAYLGGSVPRQIANLHTLFNVTTTIILAPMIGLFEKTIVKIFPGQDVVINKNALYLDKRLIQTPVIAMEQVKKELLRVAEIANEMLNFSVERIFKKDLTLEKKVLDRESAVDSITEDIIRYLTTIAQVALPYSQSQELTNMLHVAYDVERTGDHAESIMYLARLKEENKIVFSEIAQKEISEAHKKANEIYYSLLSGMSENNIEKIKECERLESELDFIVRMVRDNHLIRLQKGQCTPLSGVVFSDIILHLERVGDLLFAISKKLLNPEP